MKANTPGLSQVEATLLQTLGSLERRMVGLSEQLDEMQGVISELGALKDWYTTSEVAELMGVTRQTVQDRWCNQGRIECEKCAATGKWQIPGHEYDRLRKGGRLEL